MRRNSSSARFGERHVLGALRHRDHLGLPVAARFRSALLRSGAVCSLGWDFFRFPPGVELLFIDEPYSSCQRHRRNRKTSHCR